MYSRKPPRARIYWILIVLALSGLMWLWRDSGRRPERKTPSGASGKTAQSNAGGLRPAAAAHRTPTAMETAGIVEASGGTCPRPVQTVFEAQVALERQEISPGSIDGRLGPQTRSAILAFQRKENLPDTGELDLDTKLRLILSAPPLGSYTVASNDLARLQPLGKTWLAKSQQTALDYETLLELVAEKSHAHPALIRRLNPDVDWTNLVAGSVLRVVDVVSADLPAKAAFARISLSDKILEVFDASTNLLDHFPCSIAQHVEKRPVGELHVEVIAPNPNYTFDPDVFPESEEARQLQAKLVLPPGPNNPVGTVWIGLDKPGYGIHGTPNPEMVGRTESHGCFRLANWDAEYLLKLAWIGMPVDVEP